MLSDSDRYLDIRSNAHEFYGWAIGKFGASTESHVTISMVGVFFVFFLGGGEGGGVVHPDLLFFLPFLYFLFCFPFFLPPYTFRDSPNTRETGRVPVEGADGFITHQDAQFGNCKALYPELE